MRTTQDELGAFLRSVDRSWSRMGMPDVVRRERGLQLREAVGADRDLCARDPAVVAELWSGENRTLRVRASLLEFAATLFGAIAVIGFVTDALSVGSRVSFAAVLVVCTITTARLVLRLTTIISSASHIRSNNALLICGAVVFTGVAAGAASRIQSEIAWNLSWTIGSAAVALTCVAGVRHLRSNWR